MTNMANRTYDDYVWALKFRPKTVSELIAPPETITLLEKCVETGQIGNFLFSGSQGIGKTTAAFLLADLLDMDTLFINMSDETGIDVIRTKIKNFVTTRSFDGRKKIVIGDECDRLSQNAMDSLKAAIEEFSKSANFIFTSNHPQKIIPPLMSRLSHITFGFTKDNEKEAKQKFFKLMSLNLKEENVEFNKKLLAKIVSTYFPDMRKCFNEAQRLHNSGLLSGEVTEFSTDYDIKNFYKLLSEKDFSGMREFVANIGDASKFYSDVFRTIVHFYDDKNITDAIIILAKYDYEKSFATSTDINIMAFAVTLMTELEIKSDVL